MKKFDLNKAILDAGIPKMQCKNLGEPLGIVIKSDFSKMPWEITIKAHRGKKRILKKISNSPILSGTKLTII